MRSFVRLFSKMLTRPTTRRRPRLAIGNLEDRTVPAFFDFSTGTQGWTTGNEAETSLGYTSVPSSWTADGFGNPADSLYNPNAGSSGGAENSWVQSPMFTVGTTLTLTFDSFSNNEGGFPTNYDVEHVEYSLNGGGIWTPFFGVSQPDLHNGGDATWRTISYTVATVPSDIALVRFRIDTGDNFGDVGEWAIDNVDIKGATFIDENGHLVVSGTDGGDTITIDHGQSPSAGSSTYRVFMNGRFFGSYTEGVDFTDGIHILAGGSTDTITILGTTGADNFQIEDDFAPNFFSDKEFTVNSIFISTLEAEGYTLKGLEGDDTFEIEGLGFLNGPTTQNVSIDAGNGNDQLIADGDLDDADGDLGGDGVGQLNIEGPSRGNLEGASVLKFIGIEAFVSNDEDYDYVFSPGGSFPGIGVQPGITSGAGDDFALFGALTGPATFTIDSAGMLTSPGGKLTGIELLVGTAGLDKLIGATQATDWDIDGTDAGTYTSGANPPINFASIENLVGGGANDSFNFLVGGALSGNLDGGAGTDTVDYSDLASDITTSVTPATTSLVTGTWTKIEAFIGSTGNNTFTGSGGANTWNLTDVGDGTVNTIAFTDYANLIGGASTDKFLMGPAADFASLSGLAGIDTLSYASFGASVSVDLTTNNNGVGTNVVAFTGMDAYVGSAGDDTFVGGAGNDTFTVTTPNTGKYNTSISYSGFENLDGDLGDDKFTITTTALSPLTSINDLGGTDTLVGPNKTSTWTVTGPDTGDVNGTTFTSLENLTGGTSADTFDYSGGGSTTGVANGGSGSDTINFGTGATVSLTSATAGSAAGIVGSFLSIENLVADAGTLNGANITSNWKLTGTDMGTLNVSTKFNGFSTINGGSAADQLYLFQGTLTGAFNAGGGTDILNYSSVTTITRPYKPLITSPSVIDGLGTMIAISGFNKLTGNL